MEIFIGIYLGNLEHYMNASAISFVALIMQ